MLIPCLYWQLNYNMVPRYLSSSSIKRIKLRWYIVRKQRPVNLDLTTIHFPVTAILSILHRISGVLMFLAIPLMLWVLEYSLNSQDDFNQLSAILSSFSMRFIVWVVLSALLYHVVAGIRHLLMDGHLISESLKSGRMSAWIVLFVSFVLIALLGLSLLFNIHLV